MHVFAALWCFIACHAGPADHFATFARALKEQGEDVMLVASGPALKKIEERGLTVQLPFILQDLSSAEEDVLAEHIAQACPTASYVITDLGHPFDCKLQKALAKHKVIRWSYYDNPEPYVPGGYSDAAAQVIAASEGVIFANAHLAQEDVFYAPHAPIDFSHKPRIGLGYYPVEQAEVLEQQRLQQKVALRQQFFSQHGLKDTGQKVVIYFGGNNEVYFQKAFPAFLNMLQGELSSYVFIVQQHPGAKKENRDGRLQGDWQHTRNAGDPLCHVFLSDLSLEQAQQMADVALYYQTSMSPLFVLAGIPTLQVGHQPYEDLLVKYNLISSVTRQEDFIAALEHVEYQSICRQKVMGSLGLQNNWLEILLHLQQNI